MEDDLYDDYEACERDDDYNVFEENCLDEDRWLESLDPEGDHGPNYEPDPDLDGEEYAGPPAGTYAHTAWLMAQSGIMDPDEADRWKDEMKEGDLY